MPSPPMSSISTVSIGVQTAPQRPKAPLSSIRHEAVSHLSISSKEHLKDIQRQCLEGGRVCFF